MPAVFEVFWVRTSWCCHGNPEMDGFSWPPHKRPRLLLGSKNALWNSEGNLKTVREFVDHHSVWRIESAVAGIKRDNGEGMIPVIVPNVLWIARVVCTWIIVPCLLGEIVFKRESGSRNYLNVGENSSIPGDCGRISQYWNENWWRVILKGWSWWSYGKSASPATATWCYMKLMLNLLGLKSDILNVAVGHWRGLYLYAYSFALKGYQIPEAYVKAFQNIFYCTGASLFAKLCSIMAHNPNCKNCHQQILVSV